MPSQTATLPVAPAHRPSRAWNGGQSAGGRALRIGGVAALHGVIAYALVTQLSHKSIDVPPVPLQVSVIDQPEKQPEPPPPATPDVRLQTVAPVFIPAPEIVVATPVAPARAMQAVTPTPQPPAPPPARAAAPDPVRVEPTLDLARSREPNYPTQSRRLGEEGIVALLVLVGEDGKVQDIKLQQSSGFPRLDEAAMRGAQSGCRFKAGSLDGRPAALWYRYQYEFRLG